MNTTSFKKGQTPWNKGKEYFAIKGKKHPMFDKHHTPESIEKIKNSLKGRIPWNKDKKGVSIAWNKGKKGIHLSPKTEFKKGSTAPVTAFKKGQLSWNKGLKGLTIGFPKGKQNKKISGSNHYNWKGGVTSENLIIRHGTEFRLALAESKERDNYTCQMPGCGVRGGKLESHHIKTFKDFPELRCEISNLVTLCIYCHQKTKRKEKEYEELFTEIINLK